MIINRTLRIVAIVAIVLITIIAIQGCIRYYDLHYNQEKIYDTWGSLTSTEDWEKAQPLPKNLDASWLATEKKDGIYYIAHALGGAETPTSNTYSAFLASKMQGIKLYEVDVFLDDRGFLRCHHGPSNPSSLTKTSCTLDSLLPMIDKIGGYAILDIKTDFRITGDKVLKLIKSNHLSQIVIFQLYSPDELAWFASNAQLVKLPTPIITVYKSKRSANHIANNAKSLNIEVLTVPFKRLPSMKNIRNVKLFTHPIHTCQDWAKTNYDLKISGIYALSSTDISKCN